MAGLSRGEADEAPRVHHPYRWHGCLAARRARTAAGDSGDRVCQRRFSPKLRAQLGYSIMLQHPALLKQLANVYKLTKRMEERARKTASNTMVEYVQKLGQESQQVATPTVPPPQAP